MGKVIITAAITGGFHGKEANPNLPMEIPEIISAACDCWNAGAAAIHVHVRDKEGKPTTDTELYREALTGLRAKGCKAILQVSTGGGPGLTPEQRLGGLDADPEMASLNMGTMVRTRWGNDSIFMNSRSQIEYNAQKMQEKGIKPEMEVYGPSMLIDVQNLIQKKIIDPPYYINFVLGMTSQGAVPAEPKWLITLINHLPENSIFNVTGLGAGQLPLTTLSMLLGGHARVGFEDNVFYRKGELAVSNTQMVERTVRLARELQIDIASPEEAREMLGLPQLP